jgi:cellulose synthase/poly-beta-1,6-N-acetylglucosamine synthase-like glycosyltransferase
MGVFVTLLILLSLAYGALFVLYAQGWRFTLTYNVNKSGPIKNSVSIIIPARNEALLIKACIDSILAQQFNGTFEIIVINDHSSDQTLDILKTFQHKINIINLEDIIAPNTTQAYKKKAIEIAINQANGDLIMTTDADTIRGPYWLQSMVGFYEANNYKIIAGPVNYISRNSLGNIFQVIDFITMQGVTAGALHYHLGSTCNGANLLYNKKAFQLVGGFAGVNDIASGDDMLLMHKIEKQFPKGAGYCKSKEAIVATYDMENISSFLQQRIRWASKSKHYADKRVTVVLGAILVYNLLLLTMIVFCVLGKFPAWGGVIIIAFKIMVEQLLVGPTLDFFGHKNRRWWHILLQPIHLVYILVCGILGQVTTYQWKNRSTQ